MQGDWKSYIPFFDSTGKFSGKELVKAVILVGVGLLILNLTGLKKYTNKPS